MSKRGFVIRMGGVVALIALLIALILFLEPEKPGISRAQAAKAAALFAVSREECIQYREEKGSSHFTEKEKNNWYTVYMDYLFDHEGLSEEYTESTAAAANQELTYREAKRLVGFLGKNYANRVNLNQSNQKLPFPADLWWQIYEDAAKDKEEEGLQTLDVVLYGTPNHMENGEAWICYTDSGDFRFEGLAMESWVDRKIRIFVRNKEIAGVSRQLSSTVVYENVWLEEVSGGKLFIHAGAVPRQFSLPEKGMDSEIQVHHIADLTLNEGVLEKIKLKKDRIQGKVLAVGEDFVEIEGYGVLSLADNFRVFKVYGEYEEQTKANILVGYDLQEFVAAEGKLCAALTIRPFNGERIRVILMDKGFTSLFHEQVSLTLNCDAVISFGDKEKNKEQLPAGTQLTIAPGDEYLKAQRAVITPFADRDGICLNSLTRDQGTPVYGGILEIREEEGKLVLVNDLLLEDYLKKVVPSEMPASYEMEALKAQAVCARTYAYQQIIGNSYSQHGAHVDDSTNYQVYNNVASDARTDTAVDETCGKILFYGDNPAYTYYYSTSCGHGTDGSVWGGSGESLPYIQAVELREERRTLDLSTNQGFAAFIKNTEIPSFDSAYSMYRWNALYKGSTLGNKLGMNWITSIEVTKRGPGGIVQEMVLTDADGKQKICSDQMEVRRILGSKDLEIERKDGKVIDGWSLLPSAFVSIEETGTAKDGSKLFTIYGGGYGHGAGMSQNGAQGMAKAGKNYQEILGFFYEGTELRDVVAARE